MDLVDQPSLCSWLFLKHFWLSKLVSCSQWLSVVESVPRPTSISKGRITFSTEMQTSWKLDSQEAAGKVCSEATSREMAFLYVPSEVGPSIYSGRGVLLSPLITSSFTTVLWDSWLQALWQKQVVQVSVSPVAATTAGVVDVCPSFSQGNTGDLEWASGCLLTSLVSREDHSHP